MIYCYKEFHGILTFLSACTMLTSYRFEGLGEDFANKCLLPMLTGQIRGPPLGDRSLVTTNTY